MPKAYVGQYEHTIDRQGRLAIPREWRSSKPVLFYQIPAREEQIALLPEAVFEEQLLAPAQEVHFTDDAAESVTQLGSMAKECVIDSQGRITLSDDLMQWAGLAPGETALLRGSFNSIRIGPTATEPVAVQARAKQFLEQFNKIHTARQKALTNETSDET